MAEWLLILAKPNKPSERLGCGPKRQKFTNSKKVEEGTGKTCFQWNLV